MLHLTLKIISEELYDHYHRRYVCAVQLIELILQCVSEVYHDSLNAAADYNQFEAKIQELREQMLLNTSSGSLRTTLKRTLYVRQVHDCCHCRLTWLYIDVYSSRRKTNTNTIMM